MRKGESMSRPKTVAFLTLGCKVNQYDSEAVAETFRQRGYNVVSFDSPADVYVINTCTVTQRSESKSRQVIRQARRRNPAAIVVVAGCYPQTAPQEVAAIPGVDLILGTGDRRRIAELVEECRRRPETRADGPISLVRDVAGAREFEEVPISRFAGRTRATLKVQEGCEEFCSYCIIPYARGSLRSRRPGDTLAEVRRLAEAGFKEIVLTGIHLGAYGRDLAERIDLAGLLRLISQVDGIVRFRLSSIEPLDIDDRLLDALADLPKVCHHLHVPLQSGSDTVLERMNRHYRAADFARIVDRVRSVWPDGAISTDVMVGFPGETEAEFAETMRFATEIGFSRMHVFQYSRRRGTPAANFPGQVPRPVKEGRSRALRELAARLSLDYHRRFLDRVLEVLVEEGADPEREGAEGRGAGDGYLEGLSGNYIRVRFPGPPSLVNQVVGVRIDHATASGATGELLKNQVSEGTD